MTARRTLLLGAAAAALAHPALIRPAFAAFPEREPRLLVGFSAGGAVDLVARLLAERLRQPLGRTVIVENRPGASGLLAAEAVVRGPHDGHALYVAAMSALAVVPQLPGARIAFDLAKELEPVALVAGVVNALVASPQAPFRDVAGLIAAAKARPGAITYASTGSGTSQHLAGELFSRLAGVEMTHVPYRGGSNALIDLTAGRVDITFGNLPELVGAIRDGGVRLLGFEGEAASPLFPDAPLVRDTLPGFEVTNWIGLVAPAGIPAEAAAAWTAAVAAAQADPGFRDRLTTAGMAPLPGDAAAFATRLEADRRRWGEVIRAAGIRAE